MVGHIESLGEVQVDHGAALVGFDCLRDSLPKREERRVASTFDPKAKLGVVQDSASLELPHKFVGQD